MFMQPPAFSSEHDRRGAGKFDAVILVLTALVEAVDPVALLFQFLKRPIDIHDAHDGDVSEGPCRSALDDFGESGGAAFRDDDCRGSSSMRGADDRAEIVRIFHAIENHVEPAGGRGPVEARILSCGSQGDDALMVGSAGSAVEMFTSFESDGDFLFAA